MENYVLPHWFVLYVRYRQEKKVEVLLKDKNIQVFLPLVKSIRIWHDRKKKILKPLFPSYVFVGITSKKDFHNALSTKGVVQYIKFGNEYARVRDKEIFQIKQLLNLEAISEIDAAANFPFKGQKMRISYGPLSGMECKVIRVNKKSKILVKIESIRHSITACVPNMYLTPKISSEET